MKFVEIAHENKKFSGALGSQYVAVCTASRTATILLFGSRFLGLDIQIQCLFIESLTVNFYRL